LQLDFNWITILNWIKAGLGRGLCFFRIAEWIVSCNVIFGGFTWI
jgi:hypothetical protein